MPLTLILMRHAKSAWDDPKQDDFDRPLNARGRKSADAVAHWLIDNGYLPDVVVVSGARRTVETWARMAALMPDTATMESNPALYMASAETILGVLRSARSPSVMLICHNPGIAECAERIVQAPPDHPRFQDYPTAAVTVIEFDGDTWRDVAWGSGSVLDFIIPADLTS